MALPVGLYSKINFERTLIAYSPLEFADKTWVLAVATPAEDVLAFIAPFYINEIAVLIVGFLVLVLISVVIAKNKGYKEGLIACVDRLYKEKNKNK